jgi:PAS domain S-box-containing protein
MEYPIVILIVAFLAGTAAGYLLHVFRLRYGAVPTFILRNLLDKAPATYIVLDRKGNYQYWNETMSRSAGTPYEAVVGKRPQEVFPPELINPVLDPIRIALSGGTHLEPLASTIRRGQDLAWWRGYYWPIRNGRGSVTGVVVNAQPMNDVYKVYEATNLQAALLASVNEAVLAVDLDSHVLYWNAGAERLYGYSADEVMGQPLHVLLQSDFSPHTLPEIKQIVKQTGSWSGTVLSRTKSGIYRVVALTISRLRNTAGEMIGFVSVNRDITEQQKAEQALRESEERFRLMADTAPVMIWMGATNGQSVFVNKPWLDFTGLTFEQSLGDNWKQVIHPDDLPGALEIYTRTLQAREPFVVEYRMRRFDGEYRWIVDSGIPRFTPDGQFDGYIGSSIDITERKQVQQTLQQQNAYLNALNETTLALINRLNVSDLLEAILTRSAGLIGTSHACVYLAEPDTSIIELKVGIGLFKNMIGYRSSAANGLASRVWLSGETESVADYAAWPGRLPDAIFDQIHPLVAVPLRSEDRMVGMLLLARVGDERRPFSEEDNKLLSRFAELASVALDNARLYSSAQNELAERKRAEAQLLRQNQYLAALNDTTLALMNRLELPDLLETIVTRAGPLIDALHGFIYLLEPETDEMVMRVAVGYHKRDIGYRMRRGKGFAGMVWQTGQSLAINDYSTWEKRLPDSELDSLRALVGIPLKSGDQVVGVLGLTRFEEGRAFGEAEVALLERFAELASIALDNARLYAAAQNELAERKRAEKKLLQQNEYLKALNETTLALINHLDITDLLEDILARAEALVGTSHGCIYLAEPGKPGMTLKISTGLYQKYAGYYFGPDDKSGVVGTALQTGQAAAVNDYGSWPNRTPGDDFAAVSAAIAVPFKFNDQVVGVLALSHYDPERTFGSDEIEILGRFAELAAIALDNAQLYTAAQRELIERTRVEVKLLRQNEYLLAMNEMTLALMNRLDSADVLDVIVTRVAALVGAPHGFIDLIVPGEEEMLAQVFTGSFAGFDYRLKRGEGISGRVWETGQPFAVDDYATWPGRMPDPAFDGYHATMAVPLKSGNRVIGALGLSHEEAGRLFSEDDIEIAGRFAELASIALDNVQLYQAAQQELAERRRAEEQLRRLNADLEQRVLERTAQLQQERTLLRTILDDMGEGVIYSTSQHIRYANQALAQLTGYRVTELVDQPTTLLMSDLASPEETELFLRGFAEPGATWRGEARFRRKDGADFTAALVAAPVVEPGSVSPGTITIVRDITKEKELQAQKARFIANASHELRTPLTSLKTRLYLLRKQPDRFDDHLEMLERVTDRMIRLVEDLLDVSRFERGVIPLRRQNIGVQTLLRDVVQLQQPEADRKRITLNLDLPDYPVYIYADPARMMQVITNLLVNATNYTPEGGHVDVQLVMDADGAQRSAVIRVCDNGIGIPAEHLPRVFEPFYRASEGDNRGTGLGLSISREIIELHGGSLTVESEPGQGSTFCVRLTTSDALALEDV